MNPGSAERLKGDGVLLAVTALWGVTFVVVKDSLSHADPFSWLAMRFAIGALVLSAVARRDLFHGPSVRAGLVVGVFLFLGFATQTSGLVFTTPSRSAFITGMSVLMVPFASIALLRRWPLPPSLLGVLFAVAGMWELTGGLTGINAQTMKGDLLTLACAIAFAVQIVLTERFAPKVKIVTLVAVQLWWVSVGAAVGALVRGPKVELTGSLVSAVLFCGVFASAFAILVQTWAQARTTAVRAALIFSLEPVFAAAYSVLAGREVLGQRELTGGILIVAGVVVAEVGNAAWARWREA
jgi:drug/metabolite transporter (DMT)-like permease